MQMLPFTCAHECVASVQTATTKHQLRASLLHSVKHMTTSGKDFRQAHLAYLCLQHKGRVLRVWDTIFALDRVGRLELVASVELQPGGSGVQLQSDPCQW